ncbi:MAG: aromatic amino acid ammonia-lyase [Dysgonamonadaceae bacterium]|jgi:histidine ammonia-lyase|nr:aromatic amino acid ammonia-lyase [Dysgonamonadaceae bacterium]
MRVVDKQFSIESLEDILFKGEKIVLSQSAQTAITECFQFLQSFSSGKIIYGINTGFGPMAQYRIDDESLIQLQYNIIRSHATGAGNALPDLYVRAAMLARLGTFVQARSGVHIELVELLAEFINRGIYPYVPEHGSVGASGDLVQLAHIALAMTGEGKVHYWGQWRPACEVLQENNLKPFRIRIREGLSVTNGTSVMAGTGLVNIIYAKRLLESAVLISAWINEITAAYDDFMSAELHETKHHAGQRRVAEQMRGIIKDSRCLSKRETLWCGETRAGAKVFEEKIQGYYSLRCVPQILGPVADAAGNAEKVVIDEINSVCDNPVVDPVSRNIYHGGNFHGDYVSFEMDKLKIAVTKLSMLMERQLNYLCHDKINGILPPFLNLGVPGLNYGLQAAQFTATSTTAENQVLSNPVYVHSIPNNNDNQDIVSMGTNSALLAKTVIDNAFQVTAVHCMALAQATDCLRKEDKLSSPTRRMYRDIREIFPLLVEDRPLYSEIANIKNYLMDSER